MLISRTTVYGLIAAVLIVAGCSVASSAASESDQKVKSEWVEVTIHMPDGRVIVSKERRHPSRVKLPSGSRAMPRIIPELPEQSSEDQSSMDVDVIANGASGGGVSGGLPSHSGSASGGGGGGGGSGGGGGGGGSSGTTVPVNPNQTGNQNGGNGGNQSEPESDDETEGASVTTSTEVPLTVYAWDNDGAKFSNISEAIIVAPRNRTPQQLAREVQRKIAEINPNKIGLRFWKEFTPADQFPFDLSDPNAVIGSGGFRGGLVDYWNQFAVELASLGIEPDYLLHDMEDGIDFWHVPEGRRRWFFDQIMTPESDVYYLLPRQMRQVTVGQFMDFRDPLGTIALNAYSQFAAEFRAKFFEDVFVAAFDRAYSNPIPESNYRDTLQSFDLYSRVNRPIARASVMGISSPVVYLEDRSESLRYRIASKNGRWNRLIDKINRCRSAAAMGPVVPWIAPPGYGRHGPNTWSRPSEIGQEMLLWEMLMVHLGAMGVDSYLLWNPGSRVNPNYREVDRLMDQWVGAHQAHGTFLTDLPEIPIDADQITTNGVTTTYQEFLQAMGLSDN